MITIEHDHADYVVCRVAGKLTKSDYHAAIPELENAMLLRRADIRLLIELEDFKGWEADALWEDLKFDVKHWKDFERIAVVGQSSLEKWGTRLSKPFFCGEVRFFDWENRDRARAWLSDDHSAGSAGTPVPQEEKRG